MLERRDRTSMSWGLRRVFARRDCKASTSERMELHFARRWVAKALLVSGVVGFSWSLVVCIVVDDGGLG